MGLNLPNIGKKIEDVLGGAAGTVGGVINNAGQTIGNDVGQIFHPTAPPPPPAQRVLTTGLSGIPGVGSFVPQATQLSQDILNNPGLVPHINPNASDELNTFASEQKNPLVRLPLRGLGLAGGLGAGIVNVPYQAAQGASDINAQEKAGVPITLNGRNAGNIANIAQLPALMVGGPSAIGADGLAARLAAGAGTGALFGELGGVGSGTAPTAGGRVVQALPQAAIGGVAGLAAAGAGEVDLGKVAQAVRDATGHVASSPLVQDETGSVKLPGNAEKPSVAQSEGPNLSATDQVTQDALNRQRDTAEFKNSPANQTNNQIDLKAQTDQAAIAESKGIVKDVGRRIDQATTLGSGLSENDLSKLSDAANGEKVGHIDNPELFQKTVDQWKDGADYGLTADRAAGGSTKRFNNGNFSPLYLQASPEAMDALKIPEDQRFELGDGKTGYSTDTPQLAGDYRGYHNMDRQYSSYSDAAAKSNGILQPLNANALEDWQMYKQGLQSRLTPHLLLTQLERLYPNEVSDDMNVHSSSDGTRLIPAADGQLPFNVSERLNKVLNNYKQAWTPDSVVGQAADKALQVAGQGTKKVLFLGTPFHAAHIAENVTDAELLNGHPVIAGKSLGDALTATATRGGYDDLINHYRDSGTLGFAEQSMGIEIRGGSRLNRWIDGYALNLADAAKNNGIEPGSQEAVDLGKAYNQLLGRKNAAVEGSNPTIEKMTSYFALAPDYLRTQLGLVKDALLPKKLSGAGYDNPLGLFTPGGATRSAVVGPRVLGALTAITASAIIMHRFPTWQDALNEAGLNPNDVNPNIDIAQRNSKGERQTMVLPTDPAGLTAGLATDPKHFGQSREAPIMSFITKLATNQNWNGQPLADPNSPNYAVKLAKNAAINSLVPIGVQNYTNLQNNPNNPNVIEGTLQQFGLRLKTNPNDPQVQANKNYFNTLTQTSNQLKAGTNGQYWAQQFANLHPANTTDATGTKYPAPYNPLSSEQKYGAYTTVDGNGNQVLSPVFAADQKLNNSTPGYPGSPLYKLNGTGVDVTGKSAPQALVALQYQHAQDPAAKTVIMNANGGQNGWLGKYEASVSQYNTNYQQNLSNYFQGLGWTSKAIDTYWKQHPSVPDPIDQVNFDAPTTNLINQYYNLSASDPTAAAQFFSKNASVLGPAFDQTAQHANALRTAKGELQLQGYPTESPQVTALLASMPQGADTASKAARGAIIKNNPAVNQYLANVALYESISKGAQFKYKNPGNMTATEGQNINSGGQAGQTFLKDTSSLAKYDIGQNAAGQYSFMSGGAVSTGNVGSSGSSSQSSFQKRTLRNAGKVLRYKAPRVYMPKKKINLYSAKARKAKVSVPGYFVPGQRKPKVSLKAKH